MNLLRRLPVSRLLLLCALVLGIGISATALAFALGTGAKPPAKPLPQAVHDALEGAQGGSVQGVSANITLSNHLLEGANLADGAGGGLASSPLLAGGSGRLWVAKDGRMRIELQAQNGDTQIVYDGHTVTIYDAANNTVYRYTPKNEGGTGSPAKPETGTQTPSVAEIEKSIADIRKHAKLSEATPTNVAGQPAYTVRIAPNEGGSLLGGAELSFDANNGAPLRAAVYSSTNSSPVIELAATEVSFGAVPDSVFQIAPPAGAKVEELALPSGAAAQTHDKTGTAAKDAPKVSSHGQGISSVGVLEAQSKSSKTGSELEALPKVKVNGLTASELRTELGTILTFERAGVRYVVAGAVAPSAVEAIARGL
jgi:outer membrane lipoprotein-sorting protein